VSAAHIERVATPPHHHRLCARLPVEDRHLCGVDAAVYGHNGKEHHPAVR